MAAITISSIPMEHLKSVADELEMMASKVRLMTDPEFWERYQRGMEQIARGESITHEQLLEKYEIEP